MLGTVSNNKMLLSDIGLMIDNCVNELPRVFSEIEVSDYVIMPNHIHFVITNTEGVAVPEVVRRFKAKTSYLWHHMNKAQGGADQNDKPTPLWQYRYFDRIIRNNREFEFVRNYIFRNPERWYADKLNAQCCEHADDINALFKEINLHKDADFSHYFDAQCGT